MDRNDNQHKASINITEKDFLTILRLPLYSIRLYNVGDEQKIKMHDELKQAKTDNTIYSF